MATEIAWLHGFSFEQLKTPSRLRKRVRARQHVAADLSDKLGLTSEQIARVLDGNWDSATIRYGRIRHRERIRQGRTETQN